MSRIVNARKWSRLGYQNYACLLVKKNDWVESHNNIFCRFRNFPPDPYQRNVDNRSCACCKVYSVDNLTENINLWKKESTRPKLTLYLPSVENMVACIFAMPGNNIHVESFCLTPFFNWETSNIETNIGVSEYSVRKARNWSDGIVPQPGQQFSPVLLLIITLAGRA